MTDRRHAARLETDLATLASQRNPRRRFLQLMGCMAALPLVGCARDTSASGTAGTAGTDDADVEDDGSTELLDTCSEIPEETAGPYPGDGSNGANALALSGIVRSDIRASIAGASATAEGVPLTIQLTLVNPSDGCTPMAGYAVYLWHCDREGNYSMYSAAVKSENYLRGVQESDESGSVTFTTIFPGCYAGRVPHVHFEVYPSLDAASRAGNEIATSQLAFPMDACEAVYASDGYQASVSNLSRISFATDNVFSDGAELQLATMSGSVEDGYAARLTVGVRD